MKKIGIAMLLTLCVICAACGTNAEESVQTIGEGAAKEELTAKNDTEKESASYSDTKVELTTNSDPKEGLTSDSDTEGVISHHDTNSESTLSNSDKLDYGVYLSADSSQMNSLPDCETIVIDAQYFSKEDITSLKKRCTKVYSYINVGALEDFRDYYDDYKDLSLGAYENWEEEVWVDVSNQRWQRFMEELSQELLDKGIDGFFVDNCDVYYNYETDAIYTGLEIIVTQMYAKQKDVVINGGDMFVKKYYELHHTLTGVLTGVNQESVFSQIDFSNKTYGEPAKEEDHLYYLEYLQLVGGDQKEVFLLEYTKSPELLTEIEEYCNANGYRYYAASSIELDVE